MANNDRCQDCGRLLPADDWSSVCCDECYVARGIDLWPTEKDGCTIPVDLSDLTFATITITDRPHKSDPMDAYVAGIAEETS